MRASICFCLKYVAVRVLFKWPIMYVWDTCNDLVLHKSISTFPLSPSIQTARSSKLELLTESVIESLNDCFGFSSSTETFFRYKYTDSIIILVLFTGFAMLSDRLIVCSYLYFFTNLSHWFFYTNHFKFINFNSFWLIDFHFISFHKIFDLIVWSIQI